MRTPDVIDLNVENKTVVWPYIYIITSSGSVIKQSYTYCVTDISTVLKSKKRVDEAYKECVRRNYDPGRNQY